MQSRARLSFWLLCLRLAASATRSALRPGNLKLRVAVSGFVSALVTSALALAQAPAPPPAGATVEQKVEKAEKRTAKAAPQRKAGARGAAADRVVAPPANAQEPAAPAVPDQPNRGPLIQQFTTQARPTVRAELIFVRNICQLDREKFRQINRAADQALNEVATTIVDAQLRPRVMLRAAPAQVAGRAVPPAAGARLAQARAVRAVRANSDGGKLLQDALTAVMKKHLSPEQWSHYQAEVDKRNASRKQIALRYLVDSLDRDLYLSDQQRDKLEESLSSHWDVGWYVSLEYFLQGNQFYAVGMDPFVTPLLTDVQKKVWQGFQKVSGFGAFGGFPGGFMNDNDALEEELGEVRKAEPQNRMRQRAVFGQILLEDQAIERRIVLDAQAIQGKAEVIQRFANELKADAIRKIPAKKAGEVRKVEVKKAAAK